MEYMKTNWIFNFIFYILLPIFRSIRTSKQKKKYEGKFVTLAALLLWNGVGNSNVLKIEQLTVLVRARDTVSIPVGRHN